jgi:RNA-binding protein
MTALSGKQRRFLRAQGQALEPVVQLGKDGASDALVRELDAALKAHELVKVRVGRSSPLERHEAAEALAARTGSEAIQVLGSTVLLFRRNEESPKLALP